jgi:hypothetical protein
VPTYHHAWFLAANRSATAPSSSTAKTGLAYEAWPGKHGLLASPWPCLSATLNPTHCATHIYTCPPAPRIEICGRMRNRWAGTRGSCGSSPASLAICCGVDYDGVAGSCGSRPTAGILRARRGLFVAHSKDIGFKVPWPRGVYLD